MPPTPRPELTEQEDPSRTNEATEKLEPTVVLPTTLRDVTEPSATPPLAETEEPHRTNPRTDTELPKSAPPETLIAAETRTAPRAEKPPSKDATPATENAAPIFISVAVERELPSLTKDLIETELLEFIANRETEEPSKELARVDSVLPNRVASKTERDPRSIVTSVTDNELPKVTVPRDETMSPRTTAFIDDSKLTEPTLKTPATESELPILTN